MLGTIRKFSSSIYAKVFLFIVAIPFVFWGMGPVFQGGKQNTIVEIGNKKVSTKEFINFINFSLNENEIIDDDIIEKLLANFIGEKLINLEIKNHEIKLSENSLSKIIRNDKKFRKDNKFSRTEYEKFLIENNISAAFFETNIQGQNKKKQLFDFIGGGVLPSDFLINLDYNKINQKKNVEVINLNDIFIKKIKVTNEELISHFEKNKNKYQEIHKTIKYIKLNPKNLTGKDEFNDLFFKKLDEIDDLIINGKKVDFISSSLSLQPPKTEIIKKFDIDNESKENINFPLELAKKTFNINDSEPTVLLEHENQYFIIELTKTENVQRNMNDNLLKKEILSNLKKQKKRNIVSEIIKKINDGKFKKDDFYQFSKNNETAIKKVKILNQNDTKTLKQELINQIYKFSENKVIVIADISLSEAFLVYIKNIEKAEISKNSEDFAKYLNLSKIRIKTDMYNTYDQYLKKKYEININYKALNKVKNYFK